MPVHRVLLDDELERAVADIERNERIVNTTTAGDGCVLVFTEPRVDIRVKPAAKETRA